MGFDVIISNPSDLIDSKSVSAASTATVTRWLRTGRGLPTVETVDRPRRIQYTHKRKEV